MSNIPAEEDEYNSSSDSDFNEELSASSAEEQSSEEENAAGKPKRKARKRRVEVNEDIEMGSGDEGVIAQGRKKRRKKGKGKVAHAEEADEESEDGAAGIRVRLRSGRGGEEKAKKSQPTAAAATANIDSIWARMNAPPAIQPPLPPRDESPDKENEDPNAISPGKADNAPPQEETINIPSVYNFAGQSHTTHRTVPISSPEAQAYLKSLQKPKSSRPLARKNLLEPNPSRLINGVPSTVRTDLPPSIGGSMPKGKGLEKKSRDPKLNTVEKSKLDWEAEVDRAGIREELQQAGKSSKDYLGRKEFLDRVETGRDERERIERLRGKS